MVLNMERRQEHVDVKEGIAAPDAWRQLEPERLRGLVMLVGGVDSGKTTLARWLVGRVSAVGEATFAGEPLDLEAVAQRNVARLTLE